MTETILDGYIEALLWSESVDNDGYGYINFLDRGFTADHISQESLMLLADDVSDLWRDCYEALDSAIHEHGMTYGQIGHDLALTRNGHGTGFWDRGLGDIGGTLSLRCAIYGERHLELGDDGRVHAY
jgi:hypothetical protein